MFEQTFKNIDDVLWKEAGCTTELDYTEQASWLLFLRYLDSLEEERRLQAKLEGKKSAPCSAASSGICISLQRERVSCGRASDRTLRTAQNVWHLAFASKFVSIVA